MIKPTAKVVKRPSVQWVKDKAQAIDKLKEVYIGLPTGTQNKEGQSLVQIGTLHEFGSPAHNIPERSFLRASIKENTNKYKMLFHRLVKDVLHGLRTAENALGTIGSVAVGDVKKFISTNTYQLSEKTIARKGSSRALVDTGQMRQAITYVLDPNDQSSGAPK